MTMSEQVCAPIPINLEEGVKEISDKESRRDCDRYKGHRIGRVVLETLYSGA